MFSADEAAAFTHIKDTLVTATLLVHPKPDALTNGF
jgi:hypothetical protein